MSLRPRILVLPISAAIIAGLVAFKVTRPPQSQSQNVVAEFRPAPVFMALDSDNKLLKLERYVGRHSILVVFFDGESGADHDPMLLRVREQFDELARRDIRVVAVSTALPQQNRQAIQRCGKFPFPLLSDPELLIHQTWGLLDDAQQQTRTGLFLIDRAGQVAWDGKSPRPIENVKQLLPATKNPSPLTPTE